MTTIVGTFATSVDASAATFTVPSGVTAGMTGVFATGNASGTQQATAIAATGATFTLVDHRAATNLHPVVWTGTGLTAGATVTLTVTAGWSLHHFYTDEFTVNAASVSAAVRASNTAVTTSGSLTPAAGQIVLVVGVERVTATLSATPTVTSSGGETVSAIAYQDTPAGAVPGVSVYFGKFTASAASARTATLTYDVASQNGYAALLTTASVVSYVPDTRRSRLRPLLVR